MCDTSETATQSSTAMTVNLDYIYWQTGGTSSGYMEVQSVTHPHHLQGTQSFTTPVPQHSRPGAGDNSSLWTLKATLDAPDFHQLADFLLPPCKELCSAPPRTSIRISRPSPNHNWAAKMHPLDLRSKYHRAFYPTCSDCSAFVLLSQQKRVSGSQPTVSSHLTKLFMSINY